MGVGFAHPVAGLTANADVGHERRAELVGPRRHHAAGPAIIILGARPEMGGKGGRVEVTIHIDFLIAFPPPRPQRIEHDERISDVDSSPLNFDEIHITHRTGRIGHVGPPVSMEIVSGGSPAPRRDAGQHRDADRLVGKIVEADIGAGLIGHDPAADQRAVGLHFAFPHVIGVDAIDVAEEIAERAPDGRFIVETHFQHRRTQGLGQIRGLQAELQLADGGRTCRQFDERALTGRDGLVERDRRATGEWRRIDQLRPGALDQRLIGRQHRWLKRFHGGPGGVGAVVDMIIERLGLLGDLDALAKWNRQIEAAGTRRGLAKGRGHRTGTPHQVDQLGGQARGGFAIDVKADVRANPVVEIKIEERGPNAGDHSRAGMFHHHRFRPALVGLVADDLIVIAVGEPAPGIARGNRRPIITARLQRAVGIGRRVGYHRAIHHLPQQRGEGDIVGSPQGGSKPSKGDCGGQRQGGPRQNT